MRYIHNMRNEKLLYTNKGHMWIFTELNAMGDKSLYFIVYSELCYTGKPLELIGKGIYDYQDDNIFLLSLVQEKNLIVWLT